MFRERTVIVLGAGASWHYGFPTGEELISAVEAFAERASGYFELLDRHIRPNLIEKMMPSPIFDKYKISTVDWEAAKKAIASEGLRYDNLKNNLYQIRPLVIDYFLNWNKSLQDVGKVSIAGALLRAELNWMKEGFKNPSHRNIYLRSPDPATQKKALDLDLGKFNDHWHRFIVHKLVYGCLTSKDLFNNNVHFVTFNYDVSLEHVLYTSLSAIELFDENDVVQFIKDRVKHVYGQTRNEFRFLPTNKLDKALSYLGDPTYHKDYNEFLEWKTIMEDIHHLSTGIRTIDDIDKEGDPEGLAKIIEIIDGTKNLYILGYGFDVKNNYRIGLKNFSSKLDHPPFRRIMFTNFSDTPAINKRIAKLFALDPNQVAKDKSFRSRGSYSLFEKSTANVYDALSRDFFTESEEFLDQ